MKRRGKFFLSPVPHPKALAWPQIVKTSNAEAHADMYSLAKVGGQYTSNGRQLLQCL